MPVVLVVDDEVDLLAALSDALNDEGWKVLAASSARAALAAAHSCAIDVVLCDVLLRDTDGQTVADAFRRDARLGAVPFVFMTASVPEARRLVVAHVLLKPFRIGEAVEMLEHLVPSGAPAPVSLQGGASRM